MVRVSVLIHQPEWNGVISLLGPPWPVHLCDISVVLYVEFQPLCKVLEIVYLHRYRDRESESQGKHSSATMNTPFALCCYCSYTHSFNIAFYIKYILVLLYIYYSQDPYYIATKLLDLQYINIYTH